MNAKNAKDAQSAGTYYFGQHKGQRIKAHTFKKAAMTVAATVKVWGVWGVTVIGVFETERKARNFADREGWSADQVVIVPVAADNGR